MEIRNVFVPLAALAVLAVSLARAAPLDRGQLPGDTKWFLHVDFDAARASDVGAAIREAWLDQPAAKQALDQFRAATGSDPISDLHGVTVFNTGFEPGAGVVLVHGKLDKDHLTRLTETFSDHASAGHGRYTIHTWTDVNNGRKTAGAVRGDDTVVLSQSASAVGAELDLLDGKGETLASRKSADGPQVGLLAPSAPGTTLVAAAAGLSSAQNLPFRSPVLRECDALTIAAGDHDGRAFVHAQLLTKSADVAAQVRSLVDGLKALVQLQSAQNPGVAKALAPMKVTTDGPAVHIDWQAPTAEVVKAIHEQAARSGRPTGADTTEPAGGAPRAH